MIRVTSNGVSLFRQLDALKLPPGKKKRINQALAKKVGVYARKHIREQRDVDGRSFAKRAEIDPEYDTGKRRGKMLKNIAKTKYMKAMGNADQGKVYFNNPLIGSTAKQQQDGWNIPEGANQKPNSDNSRGDEPATRRQGQRLLSLGFKVRTKRGYKRPALKWIVANLTINRAGFLIRLLDDEEKQEKKKAGKLPGRSFLGVRSDEQKEMTQLLVDLILKQKG